MPRMDKEWVNTYFNNGVDVDNRRVFLWGDINEDSIGSIIKGIYLMETLDKKRPVELFVSSWGGDVSEMFGLYDVLNTVRCPIHTCAVGKCMSAAPLLVAAGTAGNRWAMPNCSFMVHEASGNEDGRIQHLKAAITQAEKEWKIWASLMANHTNRDEKFWINMTTKRPADCFFDASRAIDYGIVDQLWNENEGEG